MQYKQAGNLVVVQYSPLMFYVTAASIVFWLVLCEQVCSHLDLEVGFQSQDNVLVRCCWARTFSMTLPMPLRSDILFADNSHFGARGTGPPKCPFRKRSMPFS